MGSYRSQMIFILFILLSFSLSVESEDCLLSACIPLVARQCCEDYFCKGFVCQQHACPSQCDGKCKKGCTCVDNLECLGNDCGKLDGKSYCLRNCVPQ